MFTVLQISSRFMILLLMMIGSAVAAAEPPPAATAMQETDRDYRIGPGDVLKITTFRSPELSLETQVSEAGEISFPLLGTVAAVGKSPFEVAKFIERRLRDGQYFTKPQVSILVTEHLSKVVSINGHVARPGRYPIETGRLRLSELVALAGGILPTGSDDVVILRDTPEGSRRMTVTLSQLFDGPAEAAAADDSDPVVLGGDRVFVDRAAHFYISGEVQRPGEYPISRNLTVGQALALGGGVTPRGNKRNIRVYRGGSEVRKGIQVKLDFKVLPNDEIVVQQRIF